MPAQSVRLCLAFVVLLFAACDSTDDNGDANNPGGENCPADNFDVGAEPNTLTATVDGEPWEVTGANEFVIVCTDSGTCRISMNTRGAGDQLQLDISSADERCPGDLDPGRASFSSDIDDERVRFSGISGTITLEGIDVAEEAFAGTFDLTFEANDGSGRTISVTNGRFYVGNADEN